VLDDASLEASNLKRAILKDVTADGANLRGANLRRAKMGGATLFRADFTGATLELSVLNAAVLTDAKGLTQDQISTACGDGDTRLPNGLMVKLCK
jgi:uncharacterized protein YjbI with pentapeptide repeats